MTAINESVSNEITATRLYDAPRELVFRMWTEPEHIRQWWGPRGFTTTIQEMDVRPGGVWLFVMHGPDGTDYNNKIVYSVVARPERLTYSHVTGPLFDAYVTFTEEGNRTRVDMRMVFESPELRNKVAEEFGAVEGLHQTLDRLGEKVASSDLFVTARTFAAPRELVFDMWTQREHLIHWFTPRGLTMFACENDLRPGGIMHYGMRAEDGSEVWGRWTYREIVRPERLVFIVSFSDPQKGLTKHPMSPDWPAEMLSVITFMEHEGKTTVTVEWTPWNATDTERTTFIEGRDSMKEGWGGTLDQLEEYLATR